MGNKRKSDDEKLQPLSIALPGWLRDKVRQQKGYNKLIEKLLIDYFKKEGK